MPRESQQVLPEEPEDHQRLNDSLILRTAMRTASGSSDLIRVAAFNGRIHGAALTPSILSLATHYGWLADRDVLQGIVQE